MKSEIKEADIRYIAGLDISFSKIDNRKAVATLAVHEYSMYSRNVNQIPKCVYKDHMEVVLRIPYNKENFTYREGPYYVIMLNKLKLKKPEFYPDVVLVDGPGKMCDDNILSLATYVGMSLNIPTVGITKRVHPIGNITIGEIKRKERLCRQMKDFVFIQDDEGNKLGVVMRSTNYWAEKHNFLYVSAGYRISLDDAIKIARRTCLGKVLEPIKVADLMGRQKVAIMDQLVREIGRCYDVDLMVDGIMV